MSTESNPVSKPDLTTFEIAQGAPAGPPACTSCSREIRDIYHEANGAVICSPCRASLQVGLGGSGFRRFGRSLGFGLVGAAIGSVLWFAVLALFDMELGLLAIVVGFLVGKGVHMGSYGRGGWKYQTLAVVLTYSAIVVTYIPFIVKGMAEGAFDPTQFADSMAVAGTPAGDAVASTGMNPLIERGLPEALDTATSDVPLQESIEGSAPSAAFMVGAGLVVLVALFAMAAAAPILAGLDNIIGLLIIAFALYQAWSMNKRVELTLTGPYRVGVPRDAGGPATA